MRDLVIFCGFVFFVVSVFISVRALFAMLEEIDLASPDEWWIE